MISESANCKRKARCFEVDGILVFKGQFGKQVTSLAQHHLAIKSFEIDFFA